MLTEMFIRQHLSAACTLRTSSAQPQLLLLTVTRIMVSVLRLVTLVRSWSSFNLFPRANVLSCRLPRRVRHPYIWSSA